MRNALLLAICLIASALAAQSGYDIRAEVGIGGTENSPGIVAGPFAQLTIHIQRHDLRPFKGRVSVDLHSGSRRRRGGGPFGGETPNVELSQDLTLDEGVRNTTVRFELPLFGTMIEGQAALEVDAAGAFEPVAATGFSSSVRGGGRMLAGFISQARLAGAQGYVFAELVEIQPQELPESWKLLACFDVIILNDDRLTRKQSEALVDYVVAGGLLIISPNTNAAFNPELPAARLLGVSGGNVQTTARLSEFAGLLPMPKLSGMSRTPPGGPRMSAPEGEPVETEPGSAPSAEELPLVPESNSDLLLWTSAGRARPVEDLRRLLSYTRAGAGAVALLHTDLSQYPLVAPGSRRPTSAGINLLAGALKFAQRGGGNQPLSRMADSEPREVLEIAGKRIPGRDFQVLLIFLYVGAAGVGLFVLARRLKRPEIYPAALLGLALISVLIVFSLGEVYKRSGDRARAGRLLVSDGATGRNAMFTVGCAYIVDQTGIEFSQDRASWLIPAELGGQDNRGLPTDFLAYTARTSAMETVTGIQNLVRWQNLFFASAEPGALADLQLRVVGDGAAWTVENRSPHTLRACLVLIGGPAAPAGAPSCQWHYVPMVGATGTADSRVPLSQATRAPEDGTDIGRSIGQDGDTYELSAGLAAALLGISENRRVPVPRSQAELERTLELYNLVPAEGEFLVLALLPEDAVSKGSLGLRNLEPERIGQGVVWANRGLLESR